jgi:hypothetical protein
MAKSFTHFFLLAVIPIICGLSACHSHTGIPASQLAFKDRHAMREALKGTWILQQYTDSIDAGLTPKLLEYIIDSEQNTIVFDPAKWNNTNTDDLVGIGYEDAGRDQEVAADFKFASGQIDFYSQDSVTHKRIKLIASADFVIDTPDAILKVRFDTSHSTVNFVKYDVGACPHIAPYSHLINSKFITGKYYRADDDQQAHHIIFTRCGNVEGAQNIDASMQDFTIYSIVLSGFRANPDVMIFYNAGYNRADMLSWIVSDDSLILSHDGGRNAKRIVLVRAL